MILKKEMILFERETLCSNLQVNGCVFALTVLKNTNGVFQF